MIRTFLAMALAGFVAAPAFALDEMSCAGFTALDAAARAEAVSAAEGGMMASGNMMAPTGDKMAPEETARAAAAACAGHPDMMLGEAMGMAPQ